jgi:diacylglycerol O-acyltransferase / wax synthase
MKHLSGVDASFLHLETPEMPMHVGSLNIFDLPEGYKGDFYEDVKAHIAGRMHLAPVFERKLAQMPFELSNPVWVDDDDIDIGYHIRRVVLSRPGSFRQLEQLVGRLHSSLIDRSRPLWEFYVIEGLHTGQPAIYAKVHHAAVDGQAGVALAKAIYDLTPEPRHVKLPRRQRSNQYQLGVAELATAAMQNTVQQYIKLITTIPNAIRAVASVAVPKFGEASPTRFGLPTNWSFGPKTLLNVSITNQRSFAARSVSLAEIKQIAKRAEVTLNDVVMAASAGALRRYLKDYNALPDRPLVAAVPVSLREAGNTDLNNQVTMIMVGLSTDIADPVERLKAINAASKQAKELTGSFKAAIPTDFPSFGAPWIMSGLALLFGRSKISDTLPPLANVAISNVPGATVPLYMAGAKLATYFPVSIPSHGVALNITVQSYNNSLDYGLTACRRALPDVEDLADHLVAAHAELKELILGPAEVIDVGPKHRLADGTGAWTGKVLAAKPNKVPELVAASTAKAAPNGKAKSKAKAAASPAAPAAAAKKRSAGGSKEQNGTASASKARTGKGKAQTSATRATAARKSGGKAKAGALAKRES